MKRIALACDDHFGLESSLSAHFGRCPFYIFVDISKDSILDFQLVDNPYLQNHQPGMIPRFINSQKANVMICGGMGPRAMDLFREFDIEVVSGVRGKVKEVLEAYLRGEVRGVIPCEHSNHKCEE
ncbi:MAG: NifB/NifX family molybdenum-iron cluster-binding protein [Candidatus Tectomicrobia bacterium]|uniref:NifB/NifX family molybdenum-iron cluster-binding protein n=1 Tax=Tectimicrobiota bacterium TaxID=2528274 RepID=A0A933GM21_UNCTE|nr:NifB/NifX family molybdenum-iron cluster-binding protein [Candidatus Tectomicrobia bacterium]